MAKKVGLNGKPSEHFAIDQIIKVISVKLE